MLKQSVFLGYESRPVCLNPHQLLPVPLELAFSLDFPLCGFIPSSLAFCPGTGYEVRFPSFMVLLTSPALSNSEEEESSASKLSLCTQSQGRARQLSLLCTQGSESETTLSPRAYTRDHRVHPGRERSLGAFVLVIILLRCTAQSVTEQFLPFI